MVMESNGVKWFGPQTNVVPIISAKMMISFPVCVYNKRVSLHMSMCKMLLCGSGVGGGGRENCPYCHC